MFIGQRIKERREALDMSVQDLATAVNVSRATIYRYENGYIEKLPTKVLDPLVKALHTSPQYLMGWVDDPRPLAVEKSQQQKYYIDEETAKMAQAAFDDPNLRVLFDAAEGSRPEDIKLAADFLMRLKGTNSE